MQTIAQYLEQVFRQAFSASGISFETPILLVEASRPEYGDYQVNGVMPAAKNLKTNPRQLAETVINNLPVADFAARIEIAGPGFINISLDNGYLSKQINQLSSENKFGVYNEQKPRQTIVVDLSGPNLAKEMHVGHLRSTVIGDALARVFEFQGNKVIRQNHVGDWGTQFGMLIAHMLDSDKLLGSSFLVEDLEKFYIEAKVRFDFEPEFADKARNYVVQLQNWRTLGNHDIYKYWDIFRTESLAHCQKVYDLLQVNLTKENEYGESRYEPYLEQIIQTLAGKNLIIDSDGAKCVFFSARELPGGEETPFIVQKKDGGFLYSTTDLAAVNYRVHNLNANRIVYVVDARQSFHFKQLFIVAKKAGFAESDTLLEHSAFGTMMNEDGRPFKTRDGGAVKLINLIHEAITRAMNIVNERNPDWSYADKEQLAATLAVGAIKYADLAKNRTSDYIFSFDKMLAFDGNTAPYLLYAYTRIQSLLRKAAELGINPTDKVNVQEIVEHRLGLHIIKFADMLAVVSRECYPHYLCQYLYNLAGLFMQFYESCSIIKADDLAIQQSRLTLADKTAQVLKIGLDLLGIQTVDRM